MSTAIPGGSLVDRLRFRATTQPYDRAYTFLHNGEVEAATLSWGELDLRSRAIAARLRTQVEPGNRVALLYSAGLDFICAFFGCLYAGVIAVPVQTPEGGRSETRLERLMSIVGDAAVSAVLTTEPTQRRLGPLAPPGAVWVATDCLADLDDGAWSPPSLVPESLALLQYTSGSTARPRGVMVSHGNLMSNLAAACRLAADAPAGPSVSWLPATHDMGLVEGILRPAYCGFPAYLMSPGAFLQRPIRWLQAISKYRAVCSGGPNFAFDLIVDRAPIAQRESLSLDCWAIAYCGAEPVRAETLRRFAEAFSPYGFDGAALRPSYGLAESTLLVTTRRWRDDAVTDGLVSCGSPADGMQIAVTDVATGQRCADAEIGEIRVSGPSVALGYWNRPDETAETFHGRIAGSDQSWLRTGDLGMWRGGELFVTGRIKDLLIVRGVKHFPQDIERTIERSHQQIRAGGVVAVAVASGVRGDHVAVIAELHARTPRDASAEIIATIRQVVAEGHGIQLHGVALVPAGTVPKTPSGKLRRFLCRDAWRRGELPSCDTWCESSPRQAGVEWVH